MFEIGQHVLCVDDHFEKISERFGLTKGIVYTIRDIWEAPIDWNNVLAVSLEEIRLPLQPGTEYEYGFHASRFRPLRKLTIDDFAVEEEKV